MTLYSILHLECHFSNLKTHRFSMSFTSRLACSIEKGPVRLRLENEIEWHSKCNRLYLLVIRINTCVVVLRAIKTGCHTSTVFITCRLFCARVHRCDGSDHDSGTSCELEYFNGICDYAPRTNRSAFLLNKIDSKFSIKTLFSNTMLKRAGATKWAGIRIENDNDFFWISVEDVPYQKTQTAAFDAIDDKPKDACTSRFKIIKNERGQQGEGDREREYERD